MSYFTSPSRDAAITAAREAAHLDGELYLATLPNGDYLPLWAATPQLAAAAARVVGAERVTAASE